MLLRKRPSSLGWTALACSVLALTLAAPMARAQKEEPQPPGSDSDNEPPPPRPPPPSHDRSSEPEVENSPPPPGGVAPAPVKKFDPLDWQNAISVYARYMFVTAQMLHPYLTHATALNSWAVGAQYSRRFAHFDVVTTLDFSWLALNNGNYLAVGNDPSLDTKYTQFDRLSFLSADVAIIGHHAFNNWLELRGGAGLGLGVVFGKVLTTNDSGMCTRQNAGNIHECYPISPTVGPIMLGQSNTNAQLAKTQDSSRDDTAANPHRKSDAIPPVMAVLDVMMALNFRLDRHVSTSVEVGFRDAMFVGANLQYHF